MKENVIVIDTNKKIDRIEPALHGQFIEHLGKCINGGLMSEEGIRQDIIDALARIEPPVVRWPGGCFADRYHWRDGIGDVKKRPINFNTNFGTNQLERNQFGTHEFMDFCSQIKAKPWININMLTGTIQEMVDWAEYCNRSAETTIGRKRKENGHESPFNVEFWGIGNEAWAGGGNYTAQGYANEYRKYASSFPSFPLEETSHLMFPELLPIKLIAVGPDGNKAIERVKWTTDFLKELQNYRLPPIYGYDLHFYNWNINEEAGTTTKFDETQWYTLLDGALEIETVIEEQYDLIKKNLPNLEEDNPFIQESQVNLIIGEWGNWHPFDTKQSALWQQNTVRDMISYALTLDIFHHHADKVKMACLAQTINVLGALILTQGDEVICTPTYYLFEMYKRHRGAQALDVEVASPILYENKKQVKQIHAFASLNGNQLFVNLINTNYKDPSDVGILFELEGQWICSTTLTSNEPSDCNTIKNKDLVKPRKGPIPHKENGKWTICLPKASVTVLTFEID